jgi:hypothetical protein
MTTLEETKLEKLLIFLTVPFLTFFKENTLDQLSQFMWAQVAVG